MALTDAPAVDSGASPDSNDSPNLRIWLHLLWRPVTALLSGLAMAASFPPQNFWWLAPFGVAGMALIARNSRLRGAIGWSIMAGVVFFLILLQWISVAGLDAWLALSVFCALWFGLVGAASFAVAKLPGWPLWIGSIWVAQEALRDRYPWGGFPWGRLAFGQSTGPDLGYAALAGAPGLTLVVAVSGGLLALGVTLYKARRYSLIVLPVVGAVALLAAGLLVPRPTAGQTNQGPAELQAAVIQGSVPRSGLDALGQREAVLRNHVAATLALAEKVRDNQVPQPAFVIWPENSSDIDPYLNRDAAELIDSAADAVDVPILVGTMTTAGDDPTRVWNIGIVWDPSVPGKEGGPGERYIKRHPVPFGEFVPMRSLLSNVIGRYSRVPRDFAPGPAPGVLQVGQARLGDVICFEVADDVIVRDVVTGGGRAIVVQTNNATFGGTAQPDQQAAMGRIRAVEHARTVLIAATSGVSTILQPNGDTIATAPMNSQAELVADIPLRDDLTISDRLGPWPEWLLIVLAAVAVAWGALTRTRRLGSKTTDPRDEEGSGRD